MIYYAILYYNITVDDVDRFVMEVGREAQQLIHYILVVGTTG
jgi:hypothetical protein